MSDEYQLRQIALKDIICFYSDKKYNYCRTNQSNFKIKSKLYEIEKMSNSFIRISKGCVINIEQDRMNAWLRIFIKKITVILIQENSYFFAIFEIIISHVYLLTP